jgi:hypothetical protein
MNFVDAAVTLLREAKGPLHVEELCRLALERELLDSPGQAPLRSLKGRLTTELKRGPESRVLRVEDDVWALTDAGRNGVEPAAADVEEEITSPEIRGQVDERAAYSDGVVEAEVVSEEPFADAELEAEAAYEDEIEGEADDDDDDDDDLDDEGDDEGDDERDDDLEDDDDLDHEEDEAAAADQGPFADEATYQGEAPPASASDLADDAAADDEATQFREDQADQAVQAQRALERDDLSAEEKDLIQAYGSEAGTAQVGELVEYRDQQTADEDRAMVPELLPERRGGRPREDWKARRDRMREKRRERREERERNKAAREHGGQAQAQAQAAAEPAAEQARPAERAGAPEADEAPRRREPALPGSDGDLARRACEVLASIKGAQPVPVRQLAQMMRKRRLVDAEPDALWRPLKSALLADHQRRTAAGLPPRVAYRGRDLFAYRPSANAELEAAETGLETAAHRLRGATERTLAARLVELPLGVLEQVAQLYLSQTGWRDVEWIKRVDRSGYAVAREPGDGQMVMVAVRSGNQEVDRRGVGELRAGVAAKNMPRGLLLAPRELGSEARAELERPGKPVTAMCGLPWAGALVEAGIGVALRTMPVAYLDAELFDRLSEG